MQCCVGIGICRRSPRAIGAAVKFLARPAILAHAEHLGLLAGQTLIAVSEAELTLVFGLATYTANDGRSRGIDRYAKAAELPANSDERLMLEAMCRARFSIWRVERRHATCGLVGSDMLGQSKAWLVNEGLEASAQSGMYFASRLCEVESFVITSGVMVPLLGPMLEEVLTDARACRNPDPQRLGDDPRFAAAIYRAALDHRIMERVAFH